MRARLVAPHRGLIRGVWYVVDRLDCPIAYKGRVVIGALLQKPMRRQGFKIIEVPVEKLELVSDKNEVKR